MERRVELPSGGWAELRDPTTVTNAERKPIMAEMVKAADGKARSEGEAAEEGYAVSEALIRLMVGKWSFDLPLPVQDPTVLERIPALDYDRLCVAVNEKESSIFLDVGIKPDPKASDSSSGNSNKELPMAAWTEGNSQTISASIS
jgi:hypothetical protein